MGDELGKETPNLLNPILNVMCVVIEITKNKHFNTKHDDLNCKVCHKVIKTSMKILKHVARTSLPTYPLMKGKLK